MESGDIVLLLPWLMAFTRGGDSRQRDAAQEASEENLERALSACSHTGWVKVAARNLLAEPRSAGNEETWSTLAAKFPSEDHAAVSAATAEAVLVSVTEGGDGYAPPWRPDDEYASEVLFDAISSRSALSDPGNDGQGFSHLKSIIHIDISSERSSEAARQPCGGESSTSRTGSHQSSGSSSCSRTSPHWGDSAGRLAWA